jgi:hypothetical protein
MIDIAMTKAQIADDDDDDDDQKLGNDGNKMILLP